MSKLIHLSFVPALLLGITAIAPAQNPQDLLNKTRNDQSLLTQRVEANLRSAIADARRLQTASPIRAANALKAAMAQLDDPLIPAGFRSDWSAALSAQIKSIETGKKLPDPAEINPVKREIREADAKRAKAIEEEYNDVRRTLDTIASLNKAGNATQAQKEAEALAQRYPNNPAALQLTENLAMNQRIADARFLVEQQRNGYLLAMRSVDKAAIMPKDDIEFDVKRWREITKLRVKSMLTKKEESLLKALDSPINLGYKDSPFDEVMKAISTVTGQNILINKAALMQAMIESNTPVSINIRGGTARTALRSLLQNHGLTFIIKDESIQVVTLEMAREMLVTRVYYLGDLVNGLGTFGNPLQWGPQMNMLQTQENVDRLMGMISSIDPDSWKGRGGNGTMTFNWPSMSLVIRQTAEVHARLGGSLGR
ncbi:MAG: STN domain-containing protein [Planctomycetes bacterium]|nr:STN domain-containing protein [Planctomycetota bacterium]